MKPNTSYHSGTVAFLLIVVFSVIGCGDRTVDPFEENNGFFSVYGALSLHDTPNYIRVKDLTQEFFADSAGLNATVIFEDLQDGTITTLEDTTVEFSDQFTHNFILKQELKPDRKYRLSVESPFGNPVSSIAKTPAITQVAINVPDAAECKESIGFVFRNVQPSERIRMEVGFLLDGELHFDTIGDVPERIHKLEYREEQNEVSFRTRPWDLLMEVFPHPRLNDPRPEFRYENLSPTVLCHELDSDTVMVRYIHFGPEWVNYEGANVTDPTESPDVEGGLGFLGAYRQDEFTFTVDTSSTR